MRGEGRSAFKRYFVWSYRKLQPAAPSPVPRKWRSYLIAQGSLDSARELGWSVWDRSIRSTVNVPAFWPWPLDSFYAQVYNAIFVTNAAGALIISRAVAPVGWLTLGLAQEIFGLFAILGVVIIDDTSRRVDWELPATWLWLGFSRRYSLLGAMTWQAYAQRRMAALGARGSSVKA